MTAKRLDWLERRTIALTDELNEAAAPLLRDLERATGAPEGTLRFTFGPSADEDVE
jgi:hypothetical protein